MHLDKRKLDDLMTLMIVTGFHEWILVMLGQVYAQIQNSLIVEHIQMRKRIEEIWGEADKDLQAWIKQVYGPKPPA